MYIVTLFFIEKKPHLPPLRAFPLGFSVPHPNANNRTWLEKSKYAFIKISIKIDKTKEIMQKINFLAQITTFGGFFFLFGGRKSRVAHKESTFQGRRPKSQSDRGTRLLSRGQKKRITSQSSSEKSNRHRRRTSRREARRSVNHATKKRGQTTYWVYPPKLSHSVGVRHSINPPWVGADP